MLDQVFSFYVISNVPQQRVRHPILSHGLRVAPLLLNHPRQRRQEVHEERPVQVFAHLVQDKPVPSTAALDVVTDLVEILCPLEIPVMTIFSCEAIQH